MGEGVVNELVHFLSTETLTLKHLQHSTILDLSASNTTLVDHVMLLNSPKEFLKIPCKQVVKILLFTLHKLLCIINCFILITEQPIFIDNVRRKYMLINWSALKGLKSLLTY